MHLLSIRFCAVIAVSVLLLGDGGCDRSGQQTSGVLPGVDLNEQPVSGPAAVGADWLEIVSPSPLRVVEDEQSIRLQVAGIADMDVGDSLILDDGRRIGVTAEVIDDRGTRYPLTLGGISGAQYAYFYRDGDYPPGPDFPLDRTIVTIQVQNIVRW